MVTRKPWKEIRASASPEVLENAEAVVTRRVQIERELRRRLLEDEWAYHRMPPVVVRRIVGSLLPWLLELVEQVEGETREGCGLLP